MIYRSPFLTLYPPVTLTYLPKENYYISFNLLLSLKGRRQNSRSNNSNIGGESGENHYRYRYFCAGTRRISVHYHQKPQKKVNYSQGGGELKWQR